jgi:hypothetical protein
MRNLIMTMAMLALIGSPVATAQTRNNTGSPGATNSAPAREAPIGHRQPRAADVPSEKNLSDPNDPLSKENALLDKKIKSICRGC